MSFPRWLDALGDRLNPVMVKELRQASRGRFMNSVLIGFLLVQLGTLGLYLSFGDITKIASLEGGAKGRELFSTLHGVLIFAAIFCLPIYAGVRLLGERSGGGLDLMFATALESRTIVTGKTLAAVVLLAMLYSCCLPFVSLTYLLRGIDLPSILVLMAVSFAAVVLAIQLALLLAALSMSRVLRVFLGLGFLLFLLVAFNFLVFGLMLVLQQGFGGLLARGSFWLEILPVLVLSAFASGLMWVLTTAILAPGSANRALYVRGFLAVVWGLASLGVAISVRWWSDPSEWLEIFLGVSLALILPAFVIAVCGPEEYSPRILHQVPRSRWRRALAFPFFSGAAGGLVWAAAMLAVCLGAGLLGASFSPVGRGFAGRWAEIGIGLGSYTLAYALAGLALRRRLFGSHLPTHMTWIPVLLLAIVGSILPPTAAFLLSSGSGGASGSLWLLPSIFAPLNTELRSATPYVGLTAAAVLSLSQMRWFAHQIRAFKPPTVDRVGSGDDGRSQN